MIHVIVYMMKAWHSWIILSALPPQPESVMARLHNVVDILLSRVCVVSVIPGCQ